MNRCHSLRYRYWSAATEAALVGRILDGESQPALPVLVGCNAQRQAFDLGVHARHSLRYRYWSAATDGGRPLEARHGLVTACATGTGRLQLLHLARQDAILARHSLRYRYWSAATKIEQVHAAPSVLSQPALPVLVGCNDWKREGRLVYSPESQPALPVLVGCNIIVSRQQETNPARHSLRYRYWSAATSRSW